MTEEFPLYMAGGASPAAAQHTSDAGLEGRAPPDEPASASAAVGADEQSPSQPLHDSISMPLADQQYSTLAIPDEPELFLHGVHIAGDRLEPIPNLHIEAEFTSSSSTGTPVQTGMEPLSLDVLPRVEATYGKISVEWQSGTILPLAYGEVKLGHSPQTLMPMLALTAATAGHSWLIMVNGDEKAARRTLAGLVSCGCACVDFSSMYSLEPKHIWRSTDASIFGVVSKRTGRPCALVGKLPHQRGPIEGVGPVSKDICREAAMLASVQRHPNVVALSGVFIYEGEGGEGATGESGLKRILVIERCSGGDLFEVVSRSSGSDSRTRSPLSEDKARSTITDVLSGLAHVHDCRVVHRDLKPEHVLLTGDGRAMLTDFGVACSVDNKREMRRRFGSPGYVPPEVLSGVPYGTKMDCFSCGSVLFFALSARVPFLGRNVASTTRRTVRCHVDFSISPNFDTISPRCKELIVGLLRRLPVQRLSAQEALEHPWIDGEPEPEAADGPAPAESAGGITEGAPLDAGFSSASEDGEGYRSADRQTRVLMSDGENEAEGAR